MPGVHCTFPLLGVNRTSAGIAAEHTKMLLSSGMSIERANQVLPACAKQLELQRQKLLSEVRRWLDEPDAPNKL